MSDNGALTLCDWQLAIAAHVYESGGRPIMTDQGYDRMSKAAAERRTRLPGFLDYTGTWVDGMDREQLAALYEAAMAENRGCADLHPPAIQHALDALGCRYTCCNEGPCWE